MREREKERECVRERHKNKNRKEESKKKENVMRRVRNEFCCVAMRLSLMNVTGARNYCIVR